MDYTINPVLMGGLVKAAAPEAVKVHLHGRLGVITVPRTLIDGDTPLEPGHELQFYFSYLQVVAHALDYDTAPLREGGELLPCLVGGVLCEVNDTAAKARIDGGFGTVAVPRRWLFTDAALAEGQRVEFYLSRMRVAGKREIAPESI